MFVEGQVKRLLVSHKYLSLLVLCLVRVVRRWTTGISTASQHAPGVLLFAIESGNLGSKGVMTAQELTIKIVSTTAVMTNNVPGEYHL